MAHHLRNRNIAFTVPCEFWNVTGDGVGEAHQTVFDQHPDPRGGDDFGIGEQ